MTGPDQSELGDDAGDVSREHLLQSKVDEAATIISDLMDMLKDHPNYHGSGPIDEGFQFLQQYEYDSAPRIEALTESELIELSTTLPSAITTLGRLAFGAYMRRRGEVINRAIEERRAGDES